MLWRAPPQKFCIVLLVWQAYVPWMAVHCGNIYLSCRWPISVRISCLGKGITVQLMQQLQSVLFALSLCARLWETNHWFYHQGPDKTQNIPFRPRLKVTSNEKNDPKLSLKDVVSMTSWHYFPKYLITGRYQGATVIRHENKIAGQGCHNLDIF